MTDRIRELQAEIAELGERLTQAKAELKAERFRDVPRIPEGTLVLVKRMLFGQFRWWPARIAYEHLSYDSGTIGDKPYETKTVSYAVRHQLADGRGYSGDAFVYGDRYVQLAPGLVEDHEFRDYTGDPDALIAHMTEQHDLGLLTGEMLEAARSDPSGLLRRHRGSRSHAGEI